MSFLDGWQLQIRQSEWTESYAVRPYHRCKTNPGCPLNSQKFECPIRAFGKFRRRAGWLHFVPEVC